jgi:hypothetical protein
MYDAEIQGPIHNCLILWQLQIIKNRDNIDHNRMKCHLLCKQIPLISFWWRLFIQIRVCEWRLWQSFWQTTCFIVTIRVWNSVFLNTVMTKIYIHTHIYIFLVVFVFFYPSSTSFFKRIHLFVDRKVFWIYRTWSGRGSWLNLNLTRKKYYQWLRTSQNI